MGRQGDQGRVGWGLVIHGGVGVLSPAAMSPPLEAEYRGTLRESLLVGHRALAEGATALDAVCAAVRVMEDAPIFNAGRGSNLDWHGVAAMDASVMEGRTRRSGAVAGVRDVRYPVDLARQVLERCPHVFLMGEGAEAFAREIGIPVTDPSFFVTERRLGDLERARDRDAAGEELRPGVLGAGAEGVLAREAVDASGEIGTPADRTGTVGAVALDRDGGLAAATSTGGMANKKWGRIGDSPVIGAGTYAGPLCGVSCTGWGEYFIRHAVAHDVHARMDYRGVGLDQAVREVILGRLEEQRPGLGGLVALDRDGWASLRFNTLGMYRGLVDQGGRPQVAIWGEALS